MAATGMLHVRIDDELKSKALTTLESMGLTAADAVRLLFHRIVADQAFPLELKAPNARTRRAMAEADAIVAAQGARFTDPAVLMADLANEGG